MATLTITNNTSEPVLVQELYATVAANGTLSTEGRTRADVEGMTSFLASVAAGDLSYVLTPSDDEVAAGVHLTGSETVANLGAPAAAGVAVHAAVPATDPNDFPGPFTDPDVPRTVDVTYGVGYDGGDVTIVGTDQFDQPQTEVNVAVASSTVAGAKIFKTVTAISKAAVGASGGTAAPVTGAILGLPLKLNGATSNVLFADGATEAGVWDDTNNSVDTTTAPDGSTVFLVLAS